MRILVWDHSLRDPGSTYRHWLVGGLEAAGHQVIALDAYALAAMFGFKGMQKIILEYARAYQVNAALVLPANFVESWLLDALRAEGVALVSMRYDDGLFAAPGAACPSRTVLSGITYLDAHCDLVVSSCRLAIEVYREHGLTVPVYGRLPISAATYPVASGPRRRVIAFAGNPKQLGPGAPESWRIQAVRALVAAGLPVEVYGRGWQALPGLAPYARPSLPMPELFHLLGTAALNLALPGNRGPSLMPMLKLRNLEIAACGGMQLSDHCPELDEYFAVNGDVAAYHSLPELVDKARFWLERPDEGARMGLAARQTCLQRHGWDAWWHQVAAALAAKGRLLDLGAEPVRPGEAQRLSLSLVATAMAHAHEAQGEEAIAAGYFRDVLAYAPDDYAAHAGLARTAATLNQALPHWRQATLSAGPTMQVDLGPRLGGLRGLGGRAPTSFQQEAALHWLLAARQLGDVVSVAAAATQLARYDPEGLMVIAGELAGLRYWDGALTVLASLLAWHPDHVEGWQLQARYLRQLGQVSAAEAAEQAATRAALVPPRYC